MGVPFQGTVNRETVEYQNGQLIRTLASNPSFELTFIEVKRHMELNPKNAYTIISVLEGSGTVNDTPLKAGDHFLALGDETFLFEGTLTATLCNELKLK